MSRRALVTGATGFIGRRLARRLVASGWVVSALVRETSTSPLLLDVTAYPYDGSTESVVRAVSDTDPDVVFHLASLYLADHTAEQVSPLIASNVLLAAQIGEAVAASRSARLVNTGTAWQHYDGDGYRPVNLYAATKQAAEDLFAYYSDARGLSMVTLTLFDTYGPNDPRRKLVQLLIDAARSGERLVMSPGEQTLDLTHVDDVVDAFVQAAGRLIDSETALQERFFVSGERMTARALAEMVFAVAGVPMTIDFGGRPYRGREVNMPVDGSAALLQGWRPQHRIETYAREVGRAREEPVAS